MPNHENPRVRILIVDDHAIVRAGLASSLEAEADFQVVGQAASGKEAIALFKAGRPGVVLVDLSLPDMDGVDLIKALKTIRSPCQYVVLTVRTGGYDINGALAAGAHAYLFKDATRDELISAIRLVSQGGHYVPPAVGRKANEVQRHFEFTAREREVLMFLARGLSTGKICAEMKISPDTVKSHTRNILGKLGLDTRSEAVAHCLRHGMIQPGNL